MQLGAVVAAGVAAGERLGAGVLPGLAPGVVPGLGPGVVPGLGPGVVPGLGPGVLPGLGLAVATAVGLGDVPAGQRLQVAAQYPPSGAPTANMKGSPHLPKLACC